jgi:hypothetical protein
VKRLLPVAALLLSLAAATPAAACPSRANVNLGPRLRASDGAFVGRVAERGAGRLTFRVQIRIRGRLGRRVTVRAPEGCRSALRRGRRVGVLLDRRDRRWTTGAAGVVDAGQLLKAAGIGP